MENYRDIFTFIGLLVIPYLAYIHRKLSVISDKLFSKVEYTELKEEIHEMEDYVKLMQEPGNVRQRKVQEDVIRLEKKIDRLLDILTNK